MAKVQLLRLSMRLQYQFPFEWTGQIGLHAAKDVIRNYNVIENLLGGNYFLNYNGWVDDNGSTSNFQNEIRRPNQKYKQVKLGEVIMYYKIRNYNYGGNSINKWRNMNLVFHLNSKTIVLTERAIIKMDYSQCNHWVHPPYYHFLPMD